MPKDARRLPITEGLEDQCPLLAALQYLKSEHCHWSLRSTSLGLLEIAHDGQRVLPSRLVNPLSASLPFFLYFFFFPPQEPALQPLGRPLMNLVYHGKSPISAIDLGS